MAMGLILYLEGFFLTYEEPSGSPVVSAPAVPANFSHQLGSIGLVMTIRPNAA